MCNKSFMNTLILCCAIIVLGFTSCHKPVIGQGQGEIIVDCIRKENNFYLAKSGLVRIGLGNGYKPDAGTLSESYQTRKIRFTEPADARAYFMKVFNEYVKPFNADARLANLISCHPFTLDNTVLQITFIDERGKPQTSPYIARIRNTDTAICVYRYDAKTGLFDLDSDS